VFRELEKAVLAKEELKEFNFFGKQMEVQFARALSDETRRLIITSDP